MSYRNRHRATLRAAKGKRFRNVRRWLKWYLGWTDRFWIEGELGRQPARGAIRDTFSEIYPSKALY